MKRFLALLFFPLTVFSLISTSAFATFDLREFQKIKVDSKVLDTVVSPDGRWTFVLTEGGIVRVFTFRGEQVQTINTDGNYTGIEFSAAGTRLVLSGSDRKDILVLFLDKVHAIDTTGSPSMGPDEAPVVVAYFSDYQ